MRAKYFPGLFSPYSPLEGRDWVRKLDSEALAVFVDIGLKACNHGKMGGKALVDRRGREHMRSIGRVGAIASNSIRAWNKALKEEIEKELGITLDY